MEKQQEEGGALFQEFKLGPYLLKNRAIMSSMTRNRADKGGLVNNSIIQYYSDWAADAGLVISEASSISLLGDCYPFSIHSYTIEHMKGWRKLTDSVHKSNGIIFAQILHGGRNALVNPMGPSQIPNRTGNNIIPREMTKDDIEEVIFQFSESAALLIEQGGLDGVELSAGNGFIIDQFLRSSSNVRSDEYGGSVENRSRFLLEVVDKVISRIGSERLGIKLSPIGRYNDMFDKDPIELLSYLLPELNKRKVAFVEIMRDDPLVESLYEIKPKEQIEDVISFAKDLLPDVTLVANTDFKTLEDGNEILKSKKADLVSYGINYVSNPDLIKRFKNGWKLSEVNYECIVSPSGDKGYNDYPKYNINSN